MIGVGVGVGFGGVGRKSATWLLTQVAAIQGENLVGLWADRWLSATQWPGLVGGTLTVSGSAYTVTSINGRVALGPPASPAAGDRLLLNSGVLSKSSIVLIEATDSICENETWEDSYAGWQQLIVRNASTSVLINYSTFVDGASSTTIPTSGVHSLEGYHPDRTNTGVTLSGAPTVERVCRGKIGCLVELVGQQSAGQRAAMNTVFREYWRY